MLAYFYRRNKMKVGSIGMGNMAGAICRGIISSGFIDGKDVYAYDPDEKKLEMMKEDFSIQPCQSETDLVLQSDVVIMAVKPHIIEKVIATVKSVIQDKTIISIVAGYSHERYEALLPGSHHLTVMPNTPARVLQGVTLFEKENTFNENELAYAKALFSSIGEVYEIENDQMTAGGALSGCGPAFVYMFIEALADGAVFSGLPRDKAYQLASQMVIGSAMMVKETGLHPGVLKDQVCSPGGLTIKGVKALEENGLRNAVIEAIIKSK